MPEETSTPSTTITLYLPAWVRKYVLKRLGDKNLVYFDQRSRNLWDTLQTELGNRRELVCVVNDYDPNQDNALARLKVEVRMAAADLPADLTVRTHRFVVAALNKQCTVEMLQWVKWYHETLGYTKLRALNAFRESYGITETDQSLESAVRMIRRPRVKRKGKVRPPEKPQAPAEPARRRRSRRTVKRSSRRRTV